MKFDKLFKIVTEAKGTKPGERFFNARESDPTRTMSAGGGQHVSPMASSPIGKDSYNPVIEPRVNKDPRDTGANAISTIKLLGKAFQVLKNDEAFLDQMRGVMNGFKKNRYQISSYQESVLKTKPKTIDNLWGDINRLIKVVNNPQMREHPDHPKYLEELEEVKARKDAHQQELDDVQGEVENITLENEGLNEQYLDQMMSIIDNTAKRLYKKHTDELDNSGDNTLPTTIPLHELDFAKLEKSISNDVKAQLQLLDMLISEDKAINPLLIFLNLQNEKYDEAKQRFFEIKRGDNYSVTIEQLYANLPLFQLINYFSHVILKSPVIKLTNNQSKRANLSSGGDSMVKKLANVKTEAQFDNLKPELVDYINNLEAPITQKNMLLKTVNGPFISRKGSANAAVKIMSSLRASNIDESFDNIFGKLINEKTWIDDDFKIDTMEVLSLISKSK
jgi:hypothetical protein